MLRLVAAILAQHFQQIDMPGRKGETGRKWVVTWVVFALLTLTGSILLITYLEGLSYPHYTLTRDNSENLCIY